MKLEKPVVILNEVVANVRSQVIDSPGFRTSSKMSRLRKKRASDMNLPGSSPIASPMLPLRLEAEAPSGLRSKYASNDQTVKPPITDKEPLKIEKDLKIKPKLNMELLD